jgi:hypothetical protein
MGDGRWINKENKEQKEQLIFFLTAREYDMIANETQMGDQTLEMLFQSWRAKQEVSKRRWLRHREREREREREMACVCCLLSGIFHSPHLVAHKDILCQPRSLLDMRDFVSISFSFIFLHLGIDAIFEQLSSTTTTRSTSQIYRLHMGAV